MEITVEQLYNMSQSEKKTGEVLPLPKDFYKVAESKLKFLESDSDQQHFGNFKKLLTSVKERRIQKLLIYLAYNKLLPSQVPEEEEELYSKVKLLLNSNEPPSQKLRRIRITTEMPQLVMPNGLKSGPYKQNQLLEMSDNYEAEFLLNNKLGEQV
ncbi:MAG: hypothetical protein KGH71_02015 [Candidatus Micrarchaeota archaeon]|nr:hypothetical protein [Candidatus Micrarchaeota archaeon]